MTAQKQKEYIAAHAYDVPLKTIARDIGRSPCFVIGEMKRQGIVVPQKVKDRFRRESRYQKSTKAWNKGMKQSDYMSAETIERTKATRFAPGHTPYNSLEDHHISLREDRRRGTSYYYIRLSPGEWVPLHRFIWELDFGSIPDGFIVQFKDDDTTNCDPENLYLITKAEHAVINKKGGRAIPYELRKTISLIHKLNTTVNEKQDNRS